VSRMPLHSYFFGAAPNLLRVRRSTWIAIGVGLIGLLSLLTWAAIALISSLLGQAKNMADALPQTARNVIAQAERAIPGANQAFEIWRTVTKEIPPPRDVSGIDPTSIARYPGLVRTQWRRDGQQVSARYEGPADYAVVLREYATGFAKQGYAQNLLSASPDEERHEYAKGSDRIQFTITRSNKNTVSVTIVTIVPAPVRGSSQEPYHQG
jgi:hypothetical protein